MDRRDTVTGYYDAIDAGAYDRLAGLLDPAFVHRRPDRTLDGRERFVAFMRDDRPRTDTEHVLDEVCVGPETVFARGRLRADDEDLFGFVDVFRVADERIESLTTYTD
ncbi:nuclear transport factor 2 family protein [Haloplanus halophilus]|uniref:nuclear transport factor 2 family protein n=1 Tax=Haloplanus halophilus TaxID=2949993 RepID=UPI002041659C|nr:nuclear transport factor 2 family protein [Haloplanus sp. GDY1]